MYIQAFLDWSKRLGCVWAPINLCALDIHFFPSLNVLRALWGRQPYVNFRSPSWCRGMGRIEYRDSVEAEVQGNPHIPAYRMDVYKLFRRLDLEAVECQAA